MKWPHWILLSLFLVGPVLAAEPTPTADEAALMAEAAAVKPHKVPRVPWLTSGSWNEICARAQDADQPILLDFTATWCGPCKLLDVMVFTEKPVIAQLAEVVTFQVDIDKPEYRRLTERFRIEAVPTVVWCDPAGREIDRFTGYVSSAEFTGIVTAWQGNRTIDRALGEKLSRAPQDPEALLAVARRLAERGRDRQADVMFRRLLNLRSAVDERYLTRGQLGLAALAQRDGHTAEARRLARSVTARGGSATRPAGTASPSRNEGLLEAALFQESIDDTLGMLATYRVLAESDRRNVLALAGYARAAVKAGRDLPAATRAALRAVVYSDNDPDVISTLAACYYWRGRYGKAIRWQNKAVAAAPHQQLYREQLQRYQAARQADPHGMKGPPRRAN